MHINSFQTRTRVKRGTGKELILRLFVGLGTDKNIRDPFLMRLAVA